MAEIIYKDNVITLSNEYQGIAKPWGDYEKHHFVVYVDVDEHHAWFDFYTPNGGLDDDAEIEALYYFLQDGISYNNAQDIDDFQSEFGYTKVSECLKVYNGCKAAWEKWQEFGIDPYDLANWLQEEYNL